MNNFIKTPDDLVNYGYRPIMVMKLLSKEICRAVKWWEKETGYKFCGKIRFGQGGFHSHSRTITLSSNDVWLLFHELQHYIQSRFTNSESIYGNWWKYKSKDYMHTYSDLATERNANRTAYNLYKKYHKEIYES